MDIGDTLLALISPPIGGAKLISDSYATPISTLHKDSSLRLADFLKIAENRRRSLVGDESYSEAYARLKNDLDSLPNNYVSIGKSDYAKAINALTNIALGDKYSGINDSVVSNASNALYDHYNSLHPFSNTRDIFGSQGVFNSGDPLQDYRDYLIAMKYFAAKNQNPFSLDDEDAIFNSFQDLKNSHDLWQEALRLADGEDSTASDLNERSKASGNSTVNQNTNSISPTPTKEENQAAFKRMFG